MNETEARMVLNAYAKVVDTKAQMLSFIDWLNDQGIILDFDGMSLHKLDDEKPENLINNFLGIDMKRVEEARKFRSEQ